MIKLWIDDVRMPPNSDYFWVKSVNRAKDFIGARLAEGKIEIGLIDIDHDAGDYSSMGGDYIKLLDWLEEKGYNFPIHIHSMNPVGVENMRRIIRRNNWHEV